MTSAKEHKHYCPTCLTFWVCRGVLCGSKETHLKCYLCCPRAVSSNLECLVIGISESRKEPK